MYKHCIKRLSDFLVTLIGLIIIAPIFIILCIMVRVKLGSPIFFKQVRIGKDEKPFQIIKFRTMTDARDTEGNLLPDADRFTKFGDFLRNTSLDELPELINVLKGDMSLVGPRPLYPIYLPYYTERESLRHSVRGGITGLAQINGRALCRWKERFEYDVIYVENLSLWNDIKILWRTVFKVTSMDDIGVPSITDEGGLHVVREIQRPKMIEYVNDIQYKYGGAKLLLLPQEIGSNFWITQEKYDALPEKYDCSDPALWDATYLSICRIAIKEILKYVVAPRTKRVVLPAFTCHSVLKPFLENGYEVCPYNVNPDLTIDWDGFTKRVNEIKPDVILMHSYFGFNTLEGGATIVTELKQNGIVIIEDLTQCLYSSFKSIEADYQVGSLRKWMPLPDGAILKGIKIEQPIDEDKELLAAKMKAMTDKGAYLTKGVGEKLLFRKEYAEAEQLLDERKTVFRMADVSKLIFNSIDLDEMCSVRRENYKRLALRLKEFSAIEMLYPELPEDVVPFMMPVFVKNGRRELQQFMAAHDIYPTVIWACPKEIENKIDDVARRVYDSILCFHCDQRYTYAEMERIGNTIENYYRGNL